MTHFSQAAAHAHELMMLGLAVDEAVSDTAMAYELDGDAEDMLLGHLMATAGQFYETI